MRNRCQGFNHGFSLTLIVLLHLLPDANAQAPAPTSQTISQPATVRNLKVVPLAGNHEMNDLQNKVMAPLVVQVLDQNDQPVEGADVTFRFPVDGPTGIFAGQKNGQTFRTNADGEAAAVGWRANSEVGSFQVRVTAFRGTEEGSTVISMTNVTRITDAVKVHQKKWWSTRWGKITIVAGAAVVTAVAVLASRGSGSGTKVINATPGSPTIGGPE
jgi:hypothetical protein